MPLLRAILFDFDGLIADTEPLHFFGFRDAVADFGITLTEASYYEKYVGLDDRDGFREILAAHGCSDVDVATLLPRKADLLQALFRSELQARPGAVDLALTLHESKKYELGICSGALRAEVDLGIRALGIDHCFSDIVTADDVAHSKPDPTGYKLLVAKLSERAKSAGRAPFAPGQCAVLEDTILGLKSGRAAGCITVGVLGTEKPEALATHADLVVESLTMLKVQDLDRFVRQ